MGFLAVMEDAASSAVASVAVAGAAKLVTLRDGRATASVLQMSNA